MPRRALLTALLAFVLAALPGAVPRAFAQGGTITGVATTAVPAMRPLRVTMDMKVCGSEVPDDTVAVAAGGALANVVVTLVGVKATTPYPDPLVTNDKCRFLPRVQLARPGAPTKTTSHDALLHTTNAQQDGGRTLFNVGLPVPNMVVTRPLAGPGLVRITCNTHQWMRGFIMVTDEMAAVTGADGTFTLTGVPPGTYQLRVWHELLQAAPIKVTVTAGKSTPVKLALTR
ncbi:MAG: carboxypeptidase regulatory-like domain-containing protein [Acidobacteriota bacterium]